MSFNLATILTESALSHPGKVAVISGPHQLTYAEIDAASDRFAVGLHARGVRPGDTVGLQLPNLPQFVIAYFGLLKAGAVAVPMNVLYKADEVGFILRDSQARMLITWGGVAEEAAKGAAQAEVSELVILSTPGLPESTLGTPFELLLAEAPARTAEMHQSDPGDTAVIVYTSGTTGRPKGAELTHFQLFMKRGHPGSTVRCPGRRRHPGGAAAVPRLRAVEHPQRLRAVRGHDDAGPPLRPGQRAG